MKKIIFPVLLFVLLSCNDTENKEALGAENTTDDSIVSNATDLDYAFTKKSTSIYKMGDPAQVAMVLKSLKAFETNNIDQLVTNFADTVELNFNDFHARVHRDSAKTILANNRSQLEYYAINMHDWETVKATNNDDEFVSLWYTEVYQPKGEKMDSLAIMDDIKIKDGKIIEITGYSRRFPKK